MFEGVYSRPSNKGINNILKKFINTGSVIDIVSPAHIRFAYSISEDSNVFFLEQKWLREIREFSRPRISLEVLSTWKPKFVKL